MQYNLTEKNMHNYILYNFTKKKYAPLHTLLKKNMHPTCYKYNMWGAYSFK